MGNTVVPSFIYASVVYRSNAPHQGGLFYWGLSMLQRQRKYNARSQGHFIFPQNSFLLVGGEVTLVYHTPWYESSATSAFLKYIVVSVIHCFDGVDSK